VSGRWVLLAVEAKKRQGEKSHFRKNRPDHVSADLHSQNHQGKAASQAADVVGTSERSVYMAKHVAREAPELAGRSDG